MYRTHRYSNVSRQSRTLQVSKTRIDTFTILQESCLLIPFTSAGPTSNLAGFWTYSHRPDSHRVGPSTSPRGHLSCHRLRVLESRCAVALAKDWLLFAVRSMLPAAWLWPSWLDAASDRPDVGPLGGVTVDVVVCCIVTLQTWSDLRVWRRPFDCLAYMRTIDSISAHP